MSSDFTVERNSKKYVLGSGGTLIEYINDASSIEFNPDGSYKGVLVETAGTQLLGVTDTPATQTVTVTAAEHTLSFYGSGTVTLSGTYSGSLTGTGTDADRVQLTFTPTAGSLTLTVSGAPKNWQLETRSIASSYIKNTGAAGTTASRVKDDISLTNASLIGQTEGTIFVEVDWQEVPSTLQTLLSLNYDVDNRIKLYKDTDEYLNMYIQESGSTVEYDDGVDASKFDGIQKIAFAYADGDVELYVNGVSVKTGSPTLSGFASPLENVEFGQDYNADSQANMWIRTVALFTSRLSDGECVALTAGGLEFVFNLSNEIYSTSTLIFS